MIVFNYIFAGLFTIFALLQINDPDPYVWIPIYGVAALICIFNAKKNMIALLTLLFLPAASSMA